MAREIADVAAAGTIEASWGNSIRNRAIMRYASEVARDSAVPSPDEGELCYIEDDNVLTYYDGTNWLHLVKYQDSNNQIVMKAQDSSTNEGGQLQFNGGSSYGTAIILDRYQDNIRIVYGGSEGVRIDADSGDITTDGAVRAGTVGGSLTAGYLYSEPGTTASAANGVFVLATGSTYYLARSTSSERYKEDITEAPDLKDVELVPIRFYSPADEDWFYGLSAEAVAEAIPEAAVYNAETGDVENYEDRAVIAALVAKVNDLTARLEELEG